MILEKYLQKQVVGELKLHAKALAIPEGAADLFIDKTMAAVKAKLQNKKMITDDDLDRAIFSELKKYNQDLAYVYKNRDRII